METNVTATHASRNVPDSCSGDGCTLPPLSPAYRLAKLRALVAKLRAQLADGGHVNAEHLAELEAGVAALEGEVRS